MQKEHLAIASVPVQSWGPVYGAEEALKIGTVFKELDKPFFASGTQGEAACRKTEQKTAEQKEREELLTKIYETGFYLDDLTLYLDMHEQDTDAKKLFLEKGKERVQLKKEFAERFYPLTRDCVLYSKEETAFCWQDGPMPWEGACV